MLWLGKRQTSPRTPISRKIPLFWPYSLYAYSWKPLSAAVFVEKWGEVVDYAGQKQQRMFRMACVNRRAVAELVE